MNPTNALTFLAADPKPQCSPCLIPFPFPLNFSSKKSGQNVVARMQQPAFTGEQGFNMCSDINLL